MIPLTYTIPTHTTGNAMRTQSHTKPCLDLLMLEKEQSIDITDFVSCCSEIIVFLVWTRIKVVITKTKHNKAKESTGIIYT